MKLREISPNILVSLAKLRDYSLDPEHSRGKHKAVLFARLGYTQNNAEALQRIILQAAPDAEAVFRFENQYGRHYYADIEHRGPSNLVAVIRTTWVRPLEEDVLHMVSAWVRSLRR